MASHQDIYMCNMCIYIYICVYIHRYIDVEPKVFMEQGGSALLIQRSRLYIDQGFFVGEFTDFFAKPRICITVLVSPFPDLLGG